MIDHGSACPDYERERARGLAALEAGELVAAHECFAAALAAAHRQGGQELIDLALCNEAAVGIALGQVEAPVPGLREILVRNGSHESCTLAAYNIARAYELRKDYKKSLFYARIARDRADQIDNRKLLAAAHNQMGNALLGDSFFQDASDCYRRALSLLPKPQGNQGQGDQELACTANLGYCEVTQGRCRQGIQRLYGVLRLARRRGSVRLEMTTRLDLSYAHMELGRYASAERYGRRGLEMAERVGEVDWIKNALYLLGQVCVLDDRPDEARERFGQLQRRFYPSQPYLADFLVGVDVRQVINLRA